jgi:glycosyltransferase involved in cell wall biosynthesis
VSSRRAPICVWFPAVRTQTGTDVLTECLANALIRRGIQADVSWLPHRAEYAPWSVRRPAVPDGVTVAHVNSWLDMRFVPTSLPVVATVHLCVHGRREWDDRSIAQSLYHRWRVYPQERATLKRADIVTAVSRSTADETRLAFSGVEPVVLHNGVDGCAWSELRFPARTQRPFRVLYCGNWSRRKGADLLAPMMSALGAGYELLFTADRDGGTGGFALPPNARSLGRLSGPVAMATAYRSADVLVFPSRREGLPLVPLEAMSCGLPVVASASSSVVEIIEDGVSGYVVPAEDPHALAGAIRRLHDNPTLWKRISQAACRRQTEAFSLDAMVDRYIEIYRRAQDAFHTVRGTM